MGRVEPDAKSAATDIEVFCVSMAELLDAIRDDTLDVTGVSTEHRRMLRLMGSMLRERPALRARLEEVTRATAGRHMLAARKALTAAAEDSGRDGLTPDEFVRAATASIRGVYRRAVMEIFAEVSLEGH
jgi:hypothetical protein